MPASKNSTSKKSGTKRAAKTAPARSKTARKSSGASALKGAAHKNRPAAPPLEVFDRLHKEYPTAHCELDYKNPYQLTVATILSAQCTDKRVNMVTPALFKKYPTPDALANAKQEDVEEIIKSTGFFRSKAKNIIGMASGLVDQFGGHVPKSLDELVTLPGVGRKTANVVLGNAFGINEGVVVDTHIGRVSRRLGFTKQTDPIKVEKDLMAHFPPKDWTLLAHLLIFHGRRICEARRPKCEGCVLNDLCPSSLV